MKVKFKNGTETEVLNPTEQKLFKNGSPAGWICTFSLTGNTDTDVSDTADTLDADTLDAILTEENISKIQFLSDKGGLISETANYEKIASVIIRYSEAGGRADIQLTKTEANIS